MVIFSHLERTFLVSLRVKINELTIITKINQISFLFKSTTFIMYLIYFQWNMCDSIILKKDIVLFQPEPELFWTNIIHFVSLIPFCFWFFTPDYIVLFFIQINLTINAFQLWLIQLTYVCCSCQDLVIFQKLPQINSNIWMFNFTVIFLLFIRFCFNLEVDWS